MAYDPNTPWSWAPDAWQQALGQPAPMQPGLGIPSGLLEQSMPPPQEIEMPVMDVSRPPEPFIGFPTSPDEAPLPVDLEHELSAPAAYAQPPMPAEPAMRGGMQPGLGIPAHMIDSAVIGAHQDGFVPMPPEPVGEIEMEPDQLTEQDRRQSLQDMEGPEFASFTAEHEEARRQDAAAKLARAATADAQQAEEEFKIFNHSREHARNARAEVETEAAKLAEQQDETWMESRNPVQKIAAFLTAIVGGLVQGRTGGRNDGLAMIDRENERWTAAQMQKRAQQRQLIGDKRTAANENIQDVEQDFRAESAFRAAGWERTIRTIEAEQQNYDPAGTSAIRLEGVRRDAIAKQQAALAAFEEREIKRMEAEGKSRLEVAKFVQKSRDDEAQRAEQAKHNRASERAAATSAGASWLNAKTGEKKTNAEIKALELENTPRSPDHYEATYGKEGRPPHEMTGKEYKSWLESKNKIADVGRETATGTVKQAQARLESSGPGGSPYALGDQEGKPYKNKDGSTFEIKDDKHRQRATEIITSAQNVRRIADLVKIMRADKGGASSAIGSPEYQELQSLASQLDFETFVGYGLGAPSEGDKQLAANVRGGKDISSFIHDPSSGFEAYAQGIEEKATAQLRPLGYTGEAVKLKRTEAVQATERSQLQNMDVWSPPELQDSSVGPEIRKRAAARAIESADALAKQSEPHLIKQYVKENEARLAEGLIDEKQAEKARDTFRKVYGRRIRDADRAKDFEQLKALGLGAENWGGNYDVDVLLGIPKGDK
jgi:hypothetical protein